MNAGPMWFGWTRVACASTQLGALRPLGPRNSTLRWWYKPCTALGFMKHKASVLVVIAAVCLLSRQARADGGGGYTGDGGAAGAIATAVLLVGAGNTVFTVYDLAKLAEGKKMPPYMRVLQAVWVIPQVAVAGPAFIRSVTSDDPSGGISVFFGVWTAWTGLLAIQAVANPLPWGNAEKKRRRPGVVSVNGKAITLTPMFSSRGERRSAGLSFSGAF